MIREGQLFSKELNLEMSQFWVHLDNKEQILSGSEQLLQHLKELQPDRLSYGPNIIGNVLISPQATVHPSTLIGPNVTIDADCVVEAGCRLQNAIVLKGCCLGAHSYVSHSVIGWKATLGQWVLIYIVCLTVRRGSRVAAS